MTGFTMIVAFLLLALAGWMRAAGSAVSRVPRADALKASADGVRGAETVAGLLDDRESISPAVGAVGSGLLVVSAALLVSALASESSLDSVWLALAVGLVVFLVGDLIPRRLGPARPHQIAYRSAYLLSTAVRVGGWANDLISDPDEAEDSNGDHDEDDGPDDHERELIDSVLEFSETLVREVMTPRPDMVTVPVTATLEDLIAVSSEEGYSRIPVVNDSDIVGLVIVKDLLPMFGDADRPATVAEVMRPVDFVPENKLASALLGEMQSGHVHQMIVVDEYGDVTGLITIEDLLEELVGEITDETDDDEAMLVPLDHGRWSVDARLPVEDLADELEVELPDDEWDTVGGLVLAVAERVPEEGEEFRVGELVFTVARMQGRRVAELTVTHQPAAESA